MSAAIAFGVSGNRCHPFRTLLDRGANANLAHLSKVTLLMGVAYGGRAVIVRLLLEKGADIPAWDRVRKTAMVYAAGNGHSEVVRQLPESGADVDPRLTTCSPR